MTEEQQNDILDTENRNAKRYFPPSGFCIPSKTKYFDYDVWKVNWLRFKAEKRVKELRESIKMKRRGFIASLIGTPIVAKALPTSIKKIDKDSILVDLHGDGSLYSTLKGSFIEYSANYDVKIGDQIYDNEGKVWGISLQEGKKGQIIKIFIAKPLIDYSPKIKK